MAITSVPMKGNGAVTFAAQAIGGLRSITAGSTQGTWDGTANDNTSGARTKHATYNDSTATLTGVYDGASGGDVGQLKMADATAGVLSGTTGELIVTFLTNATFTVTCVCTEFSMEADHEGGWTWSASFEGAALAVWDLDSAV